MDDINLDGNVVIDELLKSLINPDEIIKLRELLNKIDSLSSDRKKIIAKILLFRTKLWNI